MQLETRRGWFGTLRHSLTGEWGILWLLCGLGAGVLGVLAGVMLMMA